MQVQRLCPLNNSLVLLGEVVPTTSKLGVANESISKTITNNLALPISFVWVPKYRFRILTGEIGEEVSRCIRVFLERAEVELVELSIQADHVRLLAMVPPKLSTADYVGIIKGRTAINVLNKFRKLKKKPY